MQIYVKTCLIKLILCTLRVRGISVASISDIYLKCLGNVSRNRERRGMRFLIGFCRWTVDTVIIIVDFNSKSWTIKPLKPTIVGCNASNFRFHLCLFLFFVQNEIVVISPGADYQIIVNYVLILSTVVFFCVEFCCIIIVVYVATKQFDQILTCTFVLPNWM